jgi:predicted permease
MDRERRRIDEEVEHHLRELEAQLRSRGMSPEEARTEARRRFGDPDRVARETVQVAAPSAGSWITETAADLKGATRRLIRAPAFTASVTLTLALTLGAVLTVVGVIWSTLLRPLDLRDPDGLVMLAERMPADGVERSPVSAALFQEWRRSLTSVSELGAWEWTTRTLEEPGRPEELLTVQMTGHLLGVLGVEPVLGRGFSVDDESPGGTPTVVMLSHDFWQRRFGGDPGVVGERLPVDGAERRIIGVLPAHLDVIGAGADLFEPDPMLPADPPNFGVRTLQVAARRSPGAEVEVVDQEVAAVTERVVLDHPTSARGWSARGIAVDEYLVGEIRPRLLATAAAVLILLLAATVNVANLFLVRAADGERELAVRAALGAGVGRLARVGLAEALILGGAGAVGGLAVASALRSWLTTAHADVLPRTLETGGLGLTASAALFLAVLMGLAVGVAPSVRAARRALSSLGRGTPGAGRGVMGGRARSLLLVAQLGLTTVLLVGAGLLVRTTRSIQQVELGFEPESRVAARVAVDPGRYPSREGEQAYFQRLLEEVRQIPGVTDAGLTSALPMDPVAANFDLPTRADPAVGWGEAPQVDFRIVTAGLMEALGFRLVEGRLMNRSDGDGPLVAVVNRSLAEDFWPGESAVGKQIQSVWRQDGFSTVIGVVEDTRFYGPLEGSRPEMFVPHAQASWSFMTVVARTSSDPAATERALEAAVIRTDPLLPPQDVFRVETLLRDATQRERFFTQLLTGFAALALILAAAGVYGVVAYAVRLQTPELGVRLALGASRSRVVWKVVRNGLALGGLGVAVGLLASLPATRLVAGMLFGVEPLDPLTLASVPVLLLGIAGLACLIPARRASRLDPARVLRGD